MSDEMNNKPASAPEPGKNARREGMQGKKWPQALQLPQNDPAPVQEKTPAGRIVHRVDRTEPEKPRSRDAYDPENERNYQPIRFRRDGKLGCLGGLMYTVFILCASVALACFLWMAASDVLALNKEMVNVEITLPESVFVDKEIDIKDEDGNVTGKKTVRAADVAAVARLLKDYGLINYTWLFELYSGFSDADQQLDPGTYQLSTNLDYRALVKKMQSGSGSQLQTLVMFPEGFTMDQIFQKLEGSGVCSAKDLYEAAAKAEFSYAFLEGTETGDATRLEGFLFPDTYYFYQGMQASSAINKFLSNMHYKITDELWQKAQARNLTFRQVMTVASLIEKEAANEDERVLIASVIYNRLNSGMPLQFDSTIVYARRETGDTTVTPDIIQATDSPYNTYLYTGLPPGPICNPGMASVYAALEPAQTGYLFFAMDKETESMRFFISAEEHVAFVATQDYS